MLRADAEDLFCGAPALRAEQVRGFLHLSEIGNTGLTGRGWVVVERSGRTDLVLGVRKHSYAHT